jgi:hypothetical protein
MTEVRLVGQSTAPDRLLYVVRVEDLDDLPESVPDGARPSVVFTALNAGRVSDERLKGFARRWLELGCAWACSWGPDSERVELAFDLSVVDAELAGKPFLPECITTSHETDSLDDALWFAVSAAFPAYGDFGAVVAVAESEWAEEIEVRFANSATWREKLFGAEEEKDV